eukprot:236378-Alexandrium_andersonii.AAC.1
MNIFLWSEKSVKDKIKAVKDRDTKKKAKAAYKFLLDNADPAYRQFHDNHKKFMAKHVDEQISERQRRRPLHFIEQ